jgi:hypothetical protein
MKKAFLLFLLVLLSGCATTFKEDHYFKSVSGNGGPATNYFRLRIQGHAGFSSARYIAGFYDERAVDLFFDEMKSASSQDVAKIDSLFQGGEFELANGEKIAPLSPSLKNGAFLMIFSTNAKAVANTIGEFAESQVVADAITNLVNREDLLSAARAGAAVKVTEQRAKAVTAELESLVNALPSDDAPDKDATSKGALRILSAIAQAQGHLASFQTIEEARGWFQSEAAGPEAQP